MKPSEICKSAGFTLAELSEESGESTQHLINTARKKPRTFELLVMGLASERNLKAALLDDQSEIAAANERRLKDTFTTADMYL